MSIKQVQGIEAAPRRCTAQVQHSTVLAPSRWQRDSSAMRMQSKTTAPVAQCRSTEQHQSVHNTIATRYSSRSAEQVRIQEVFAHWSCSYPHLRRWAHALTSAPVVGLSLAVSP